MPDETFFTASIGKIIYLIDKWAEEQKARADALSGKMPTPTRTGPQMTARSFKEIFGV